MSAERGGGEGGGLSSFKMLLALQRQHDLRAVRTGEVQLFSGLFMTLWRAAEQLPYHTVIQYVLENSDSRAQADSHTGRFS